MALIPQGQQIYTSTALLPVPMSVPQAQAGFLPAVSVQGMAGTLATPTLSRPYDLFCPLLSQMIHCCISMGDISFSHVQCVLSLNSPVYQVKMLCLDMYGWFELAS